MQIRTATSDDLPLLDWLPTWAVPTGLQVSAGEVFVTQRSGSITGLMIFNQSFYNHPFIAVVIVHEKHRRKGIGIALVSHAIAAAGRKSLFVSTNLTNQPMQKLLSRAGFRITGVIENLHDTGPELIYFRPPPA